MAEASAVATNWSAETVGWAPKIIANRLGWGGGASAITGSGFSGDKSAVRSFASRCAFFRRDIIAAGIEAHGTVLVAAGDHVGVGKIRGRRRSG